MNRGGTRADIQIGQAWRMLERNLDKIGMDISDLLGDLGQLRIVSSKYAASSIIWFRLWISGI